MRTVRINEPLNCACPLMIWIKPWLMDIQIFGIWLNIFGVTEEFMRKAVCWYTHGNLATELYFLVAQPPEGGINRRG